MNSARKTINKPEVKRKYFICERVSQNRYQFPGGKNCCQRSTNDQEKDEQRFKYEHNQEKDEKRFTKTGTHDHSLPRRRS